MATNNLLMLVVAGLVIAGLIVIKIFMKMPAKNFLIGIPGIIIGLIIGSLLSIPLGKLPGDFGFWVPVTITFTCVFGSIYVFYSRRQGIDKYIGDIYKVIVPALKNINPAKSSTYNEIILDTSAIIDGRILEVAKSGFLFGRLIVFKFVLEELQRIADSSDSLRREKGRRGLNVLEMLKKEKNIKLEVSSEDALDVKEVDAKIIRLAKARKAKVITTDFNLNKVATIQGVTVLNINELSEAIKPVMLPGETLKIKVIQVGKEKSQGVGYLTDGTMIVVEQGDRLVGKEVEVTISKILQTAAGKMFFAKAKFKGDTNDRPTRKR